MRLAGLFSSGHYEYDSALVLMHVQDAARLFRLEGPTGMRVKLRDLHEARTVATELQQALGSPTAHREAETAKAHRG